MPSIILTERETETLRSSEGSDNTHVFMAWEDLIYLTDLFVAGGEREVVLLGADPLNHPHFMDIVAYLLEKGCHVKAMTSGKPDQRIIEDAEEMGAFLHKDRVDFLCDLTDLAHGSVPAPVEKSLENFLFELNTRVTPWVTLEEMSFSLEPLVSLVNIFNLRRKILVSIGQPDPDRKRPFLPSDRIREALCRIFSFTEVLDAFRIKLEFDCGFMPCCFTDDQLAYMVRSVPGFSIGPCRPGVTVGPDMTMFSCRQLPFFSRRSVFDFNSYQEIRQFYHDQHFAVRFESSGAFLECDTCMMREDIVCSGGCIAPVLPRFVGEHPYSVHKNPLRRKQVFE